MEASEAFLPKTERLFDDYISGAAKNRRFLFTAAERAEYRQWLLHPKKPITGETAKERQQSHNCRNHALTAYYLERGRLWRRATETEPNRLVLCSKDLFEHLAEVHF